MLKAVIPAALAAIDQVHKLNVDEKYDKNYRLSLLNGNVVIRKCENRGFILNKKSDDPELVKYVTTGVTGIMGLIWLVSLIKKHSGLYSFGLGLMFFGALSNVIDRYKRGYVVDYISFPKLKSRIRKLVFNIGDFMIFAGCLFTLGNEITKK